MKSPLQCFAMQLQENLNSNTTDITNSLSVQTIYLDALAMLVCSAYSHVKKI